MAVSSFGQCVPPATCYNGMVIEDMNASTGGVARETVIGTSFTTIYENMDPGKFIGFSVNLEEAKNWHIKLTTDSIIVFDLFIDDFDDGNAYDFANVSLNSVYNVGIIYRDDSFHFQPPFLGICYNDDVKLEVRRESGTKKFRAGLAMRTA